MIRVLRDMPEAHAVLMGGVGDKFQDFANDLQHDIKIANLSDRFRILPEAPDFQITQYFQALDLYVAPQRWEGFGLTPLEAMSCGLPVIATRVGAFEDIVEDGVTGTLVNTEDPQAIASAALRVLGDADIYMSQSRAARARADALFRLENEAQQILTIYRDLLA
ncbi:MAG: glycosyltransferase family 4 protein, partial [Paracoccaceae bacterium]